jgi:Ca2+-binding EF-hand superfamily protein
MMHRHAMWRQALQRDQQRRAELESGWESGRLARQSADSLAALYMDTFRWLDGKLAPAQRPMTSPVLLPQQRVPQSVVIHRQREELRQVVARHSTSAAAADGGGDGDDGNGIGGGIIGGGAGTTASDEPMEPQRLATSADDPAAGSVSRTPIGRGPSEPPTWTHSGSARPMPSGRTSSRTVGPATYHELLTPLIDRESQIFQAQHPLKLREGVELQSAPATTELLPAGSLLRVVERRTLPEGVERAAVSRVGCREGICGWITMARDDELSPPRSRPTPLTPTRGFRRSGVVSARSSAPATASPEAAAGTEGGPAAAPAASLSRPDRVSHDLADAPSASKAKKKKREGGEGSDGRPALTSSAQLEALAAQLMRDAEVEEAQLDDSKKKLSVKLGEVLVRTGAKIPEIVSSWAKRGVEPVTKMQFRQNVRKLVEDNIQGLKLNVKDVDALFESFDDDHGGTLDVAELRGVLKGLKNAAVKSVKDAIPIREQAELYRTRAREALQVAETTRASEVADARFEELRGSKNAGAKLGALLIAKNIKVSDLVNKWDPNGDGVDMVEFRTNVLELGLDVEPSELDDLFRSLDDDGGGSLDVAEIKAAFKTLQEASAASDVEVAQLRKTTVELAKTAKAAQVELRKQQKADEVEAEARAAEKVAEMERQRAIARAERERKEREREAKLAAQVAEKRAFEEKINALRKKTSACMMKSSNNRRERDSSEGW